MTKYITKYFGEISLNEAKNYKKFFVNYNGYELNIKLPKLIIDNKDILVKCLDVMDKYHEINKIGKNGIIENFSQDNLIKKYFEYHFMEFEKEKLFRIFGTNDFENIDIRRTVERMEYPDLSFDVKLVNGNKIGFSLDYMVSKRFSEEQLSVKMDERLKIIGFEHMCYEWG